MKRGYHEVVKCYRNLNRKGVVWSVLRKKTGLVVDRSKEVYLMDVVLKVSKAGRARVLRDRRKNVHAFIEGRRLAEPVESLPCGEWIRAKYNPYTADHFFVEHTGERLEKARFAKLTATGLYVWRHNT